MQEFYGNATSGTIGEFNFEVDEIDGEKKDYTFYVDSDVTKEPYIITWRYGWCVDNAEEKAVANRIMKFVYKKFRK